ncbi:thiopurine S-methyltransferase [Shewanella sp.]|uniref:thiopurine S-methyltransferase n=1 Tax=Shewanella sp. TaxID=50422 RepID=UPI0040542B4C
MEPNFWHDKWHQQLIGFHQPQVNQLLLTHWQQLDIPSQGQVFVPLCGKSLDMCYLAELGHNVLGCELNLSAVEQFYVENQLTVTSQTLAEHKLFNCEQIQIWQGDIFTLAAQTTQNISGFYDRAALIAWPESLRLGYVKQLATLIPKGCTGLLVTLDYPQETLQGPPFAVSPTWIEVHMSEYFEIRLLACHDVLEDNPRFVKKAVPWLNEAAYQLKRK